MPTIEKTIIIGNIMLIGLEAMPPPCVNIRAIIPTMPTIITTGIIFCSRLPGTARGISGGGCSVTSPPGARGTSRRWRR
ncbi:hypothetical protein NWFMUON74_09310 [Nocardia wallacei]|uniref:Uncharacterized protein n=1 Tax=Nocardia wallacei TaxID=480035 RepID=A0A7G1KGS2_9NOCA|nr:hypothetical protein NWFMUON74_09310 [Nocardia wallacei]